MADFMNFAWGFVEVAKNFVEKKISGTPENGGQDAMKKNAIVYGYYRI